MDEYRKQIRRFLVRQHGHKNGDPRAPLDWRVLDHDRAYQLLVDCGRFRAYDRENSYFVTCDLSAAFVPELVWRTIGAHFDWTMVPRGGDVIGLRVHTRRAVEAWAARLRAEVSHDRTEVTDAWCALVDLYGPRSPRLARQRASAILTLGDAQAADPAMRVVDWLAAHGIKET